jgi:hypothetical protein
MELFRRLTEELNFEQEMARLCTENGVAEHLLRLKDEGFVISEDDPLLCMVVDINNAASRGYANCGNYGLPAEHPAAQPWPNGQVPTELVPGVPGVVSLPPGALGKFIAAIPGVIEKSGGSNCIFYLPHLGFIDELRERIITQPQFRMFGPHHVEALSSPIQPVQKHECPVQFYLLAKMDGTPRLSLFYYSF